MPGSDDALTTPPRRDVEFPSSPPIAPPPPSAADRLRLGASRSEPVAGQVAEAGSLDSDETRSVARHRRPWWGMGDIALGVVFIIFFAGLSIGVASLLPLSDSGFLVVAGIGQQLAMFGWPFLVTRLKGTSVRQDWGLQFKWFDPFIGLGVGIGGLIAAAITNQIVVQLLDVADPARSTNTTFLVDSESSPWLVGLIAMVVIGAPLSEELFFRGLCLRSIEKRFGAAAAVIGSTALFAIVHTPSELTDTWATDMAVLWASIATIGAILAVATLAFRRLGPSIFAHMIFNLISVVVTLINPLQ